MTAAPLPIPVDPSLLAAVAGGRHHAPHGILGPHPHVGGITVRIPVTLLTYYRDLGFDDAADSQLTIDLRLLKRGGLKLNL